MTARNNSCRVAIALLFAVMTNGTLPTVAAHAAADKTHKNNASSIAREKQEEKHQTTAPADNGNKTGHSKKQATNDKPTTENSNAPTPVASTEKQQVLRNPQAPAKQSSDTSEARVAEKRNPSGNNGFIKINEEITPDSIPNNDPHVSCSFKVEFYNYDKNANYRAKVNFALHSPTKGDGYTMNVAGNTNPFIGEDYAGGGNDLDAVEEYKLSFTGKPHAKQGYHVKATIHADGSRGADVKHKVFWVTPCQETLPAKPSTPTVTTPGTVNGISTEKPQETAVNSTTPNTLPVKLPSTGTGVLGVYLALLATLMTYVASLLVQKYRTSNS